MSVRKLLYDRSGCDKFCWESPGLRYDPHGIPTCVGGLAFSNNNVYVANHFAFISFLAVVVLNAAVSISDYLLNIVSIRVIDP